MEPYLITLEVTITEGGFVLLSYVDPKPPNDKHFGHSDIGLEALEKIFHRIGLGTNIPQLHEETGKRKAKIEMFVNESRLTALGFNEVGAILKP
jgi:hypothetical protein